jgi:hypothetical protein
MFTLLNSIFRSLISCAVYECRRRPAVQVVMTTPTWAFRLFSWKQLPRMGVPRNLHGRVGQDNSWTLLPLAALISLNYAEHNLNHRHKHSPWKAYGLHTKWIFHAMRASQVKILISIAWNISEHRLCIRHLMVQLKSLIRNPLTLISLNPDSKINIYLCHSLKPNIETCHCCQE